MAGLGGLFGGGGVAEQLLVWGVLNQVISTAASPALTELGKAVNSEFPVMPMDPGDAATAVARGILEAGSGQDHAADTGTPADVFAVMTELARRGPDLSLVFELMRRGKIGAGAEDPKGLGARNALTDAGIRPEWHDLLLELAVSVPTQAEVLNAWLEGQIGEGEARERLLRAGMDPTWITTAYNANGQAPTPVQALEMLNRGLIPEGGTGPGAVSYRQAFLEGPWRNKWLDAFIALRWYIPPPRTVTAMHREGSLSTDQATRYLMDQGITSDLAAAYLSSSHHQAVATEKHLAKGDVITLYVDKLLTRPAAKAALVALKYQAHDADMLLDLADVRRTTANVNAVVTRTRALYVAGKITRPEALRNLATLKVATKEADELVTLWDLEHRKTVKVLTPAQIVHAEFLGLITTAECDSELAQHGYSKFDSWVLRSSAHKKAQPNKPPFGT